MENGIALNLILYIMLLHFLHLLLASFVFPSSSFTALLAQSVLELCLPAQPGGPRGAATPGARLPPAPCVSPSHAKAPGCGGCPWPLPALWRSSSWLEHEAPFFPVIPLQMRAACLAWPGNPQSWWSESCGGAASLACYCALLLPVGLPRTTCFICHMLNNNMDGLRGYETKLALY